jgi:hypothetical protein
MQAYEYRVIPAPRRGEKARGLKTVEDRYALTLTQLMNKMAREGWEYQRADALAVEERVGLTGVKTSFPSMLVFRRLLSGVACESVEMAVHEGANHLSMAQGLAASLQPAVPAVGAAVKPEGVAPALGPAIAED